MIKFNYGDVTNPNTGVKEDIVVKTFAPNNIKDALIGGGMVLVGIAYLTYTAFKKGSDMRDAAELTALSKAGLIGLDET